MDALIVNHGTLEPVVKVADGGREEWERGFGVNVFGAVGMVSLFLLSFDDCFWLSLVVFWMVGSGVGSCYGYGFRGMWWSHTYSQPP